MGVQVAYVLTSIGTMKLRLTYGNEHTLSQFLHPTPYTLFSCYLSRAARRTYGHENRVS